MSEFLIIREYKSPRKYSYAICTDQHFMEYILHPVRPQPGSLVNLKTR